MKRSIPPLGSRPFEAAGPIAPGADHRIAHSLGRSFRCGYQAASSDNGIGLSFAWQELADAAGAEHADRLLSALIGFVASVGETARRPIVVLPRDCTGLCRDECLAVSIVTASQAGACPALRACAFALLESDNVSPCLVAATELGTRLAAAGRILPPQLICNAAALVQPSSTARH